MLLATPIPVLMALLQLIYSSKSNVQGDYVTRCANLHLCRRLESETKMQSSLSSKLLSCYIHTFVTVSCTSLDCSSGSYYLVLEIQR